MVTVEPHSRDTAVAVASGSASRPIRGIVAREFDDAAIVDLVEHGESAALDLLC